MNVKFYEYGTAAKSRQNSTLPRKNIKLDVKENQLDDEHITVIFCARCVVVTARHGIG